MKNTTAILALGVTAMLAASLPAVGQEDDDSYIMRITEVKVNLGHEPKFREAVKSYHACVAENAPDEQWRAWRQVGGNGIGYHFVSRMANWAEMDEPNEAGRACWSEHGENIAAHVSSMSTRFARPMPEWSGNAENFSVIRLHQFRVKDGAAFREAAGAVASILKEAWDDYSAFWMRMVANSSNEPSYVRVSHWENFAAWDEDSDRDSAYDTVVAAVGEERADELWAQWDEALRDDWQYFTVILRADPELSRMGDS